MHLSSVLLLPLFAPALAPVPPHCRSNGHPSRASAPQFPQARPPLPSSSSLVWLVSQTQSSIVPSGVSSRPQSVSLRPPVTPHPFTLLVSFTRTAVSYPVSFHATCYKCHACFKRRFFSTQNAPVRVITPSSLSSPQSNLVWKALSSQLIPSSLLHHSSHGPLVPPCIVSVLGCSLLLLYCYRLRTSLIYYSLAISSNPPFFLPTDLHGKMPHLIISIPIRVCQLSVVTRLVTVTSTVYCLVNPCQVHRTRPRPTRRLSPGPRPPLLSMAAGRQSGSLPEFPPARNHRAIVP